MIINTDFTKRYEKIPVDIFEESDAACLKVAKSIADTIKKREAKNLHTVLGLSAASSAIQVYEELAKLNKNKEVSFSNVHIFSVDRKGTITDQ